MTDSQKRQVEKLRTEGKGYGTIAKMMDISINTVKSFCRRNSIRIAKEKKTTKRPLGEITHCENCGCEIQQVLKQKPKRFCCDKCRNVWWNSHLDQVKRKKVYHFKCKYCGKPFHIYGDSRRKYCCHDCYIADRFGGGINEKE